jgi:hypothetical protein
MILHESEGGKKKQTSVVKTRISLWRQKDFAQLWGEVREYEAKTKG